MNGCVICHQHYLSKRRRSVLWWHCQYSVIIVLYLRGTQHRYHDNWKWTVHSLLLVPDGVHIWGQLCVQLPFCFASCIYTHFKWSVCKTLMWLKKHLKLYFAHSPGSSVWSDTDRVNAQLAKSHDNACVWKHVKSLKKKKKAGLKLFDLNWGWFIPACCIQNKSTIFFLFY